MGLFDLICVGIGGTVGGGVFVLTGLIANQYAGPGVIFSWILGGFCCLASALSYAELSSMIPSAGSSYVYVYMTLGEFPAVIAAFCLSLEYAIAGAAVARAWGDKIQVYVQSFGVGTLSGFFNPHINYSAGILQFLTMLIFLGGVEMSKNVVNFFTVMKVLLVLFIIFTGLCLFDSSHITNWTPMGFDGVLRGTSACFFGYVGYDEVCCMAGEAKNPKKNLPLGVLGTIAIVTTLYVLAAVALVGMQDYRQINPDAGFAQAFLSHRWVWAQQIVAIGELITLPIVTFVSFLAQPRLQLALSEDGLLPELFKRVDSKGNLSQSIVVTGVVCTIISLFVPFAYLDDLVSGGILVSFTLTNTALLFVRYNSSPNLDSIDPPSQLLNYLFLFNVLSIFSTSLISHASWSWWSVRCLVLLSLFGLIFLAYSIDTQCPSHHPSPSSRSLSSISSLSISSSSSFSSSYQHLPSDTIHPSPSSLSSLSLQSYHIELGTTTTTTTSSSPLSTTITTNSTILTTPTKDDEDEDEDDFDERKYDKDDDDENTSDNDEREAWKNESHLNKHNQDSIDLYQGPYESILIASPYQLKDEIHSSSSSSTTTTTTSSRKRKPNNNNNNNYNNNNNSLIPHRTNHDQNQTIHKNKKNYPPPPHRSQSKSDVGRDQRSEGKDSEEGIERNRNRDINEDRDRDPDSSSSKSSSDSSHSLSTLEDLSEPEPLDHFQVPYVPYTPLFGIFINYYLLSQLPLKGYIGMLIYFLIATMLYFSYGFKNSKGHNNHHPHHHHHQHLPLPSHNPIH